MAQEKLRNRSLLALFMTVFLDLVGFGMFIPVLVNVATGFGATAAQAASINTWYSVGTLVSVIFLGRLSDTYGRKKLITGTVLLSAFAHLATGFAPNFIFLLLVRLVAGAAAGNIGVAQACIADLTEPQKRAKSMVIIGLAFGGGFALGPALGAFISRFAGESYLQMIGTAGFCFNILNLFVVSRFLPESHPQFAGTAIRALQTWQKPEPAQLENGASTPPSGTAPSFQSNHIFSDFATLVQTPSLRITFFMQFFQVFGFVGLETVLPMILKEAYGFSTVQIYDAFVVLGVAVLLINGTVSRKVLSHIDERTGIKVGQLSLSLGILGVHLCIPQQIGLYASLIMIATGTSFVNPSVSSLTSKLCPPDKLGLSFGALQVVSTTARILGPVTMGYCYNLLGGSRSLWFTVVLIAAASILSFGVPNPKQRASQVTGE